MSIITTASQLCWRLKLRVKIKLRLIFKKNTLKILPWNVTDLALVACYTSNEALHNFHSHGATPERLVLMTFAGVFTVFMLC
jgi:hypothetical protein